MECGLSARCAVAQNTDSCLEQEQGGARARYRRGRTPRGHPGQHSRIGLESENWAKSANVAVVVWEIVKLVLRRVG